MINADAKENILFLSEKKGFFSREILRGILSMRPEGCDWDVWCLSADIKIGELVACLKNRRIDGIISRGMNEELSRYVASLDIPSVLIRAAEDSSAEYINGPNVDDSAIGRLAGEEFNYLNLGYWGFVHWEGVMWSEARKKSFHSYATSLGVSNDTLTLSMRDRSNWESICHIANWLKKLPKPCGILACNDEMGVDILHAVNLAGFRAPQDVAVIGADNDRLLCEASSPSLTSIDLKIAEIGGQAALQLRGMMKGEIEDFSHKVQQASAIIRKSSHEVDRYGLIYQKAIDYIHAKPLENVSVTELARSSGVSRRALERAFSRCADSSPAALIRQHRVDAIIGLLKDDTASLESISQQAGFSDAAGLSNFIKRMTGKTPGSYRV